MRADAELTRLRIDLAQAEQQRRAEKLQLEDRIRQAEDDSAHWRRMCKEREQQLTEVLAERDAVLAERDTFELEIVDMRRQLNRQRTAMRQFSGPLPSTSAEGARPPAVTVATASDRLTAEASAKVRQQSPDALATQGDAAKEAKELIQAAAKEAIRASGGGPTSARGMMANRYRIRGSEQDGQNRNSEMPVEICVSVPRCLSPEEAQDLLQTEAEEEALAPLPLQAPAPSASASMSSMRNIQQTHHPQPYQQPPRISSQHAMGVHRQASAPFPQSFNASGLSVGDQWQPSEARWLNSGGAPSSVVRMVSSQHPDLGTDATRAVHSQARILPAHEASAHFPKSQSTYAMGDQFTSEPRWGSAMTSVQSPVVRMVSASHQSAPNPGSATIPTASSISLMSGGGPYTSMSSQARLAVQYRR